MGTAALQSAIFAMRKSSVVKVTSEELGLQLLSDLI